MNSPAVLLVFAKTHLARVAQVLAFRQGGFPSVGNILLAGTIMFALAARGQEDPTEIPKIHPLHAELPPTFWEMHSHAILLATLLVAALVATLLWVWTRPRPALITPPEVQARTALAALPAALAEGDRLSRISHIVRLYIQQAFDLPRTELNTTEFCQLIATQAQVGPPLAAALAEFMRASDRRKFSPAPAPVAGVDPVTQALALIEQSEARRAELRAPVAAAPKPTA